jgi:hypothetical protein
MSKKQAPNQITGANAGGAPRLKIQASRAARIAQFFRYLDFS